MPVFFDPTFSAVPGELNPDEAKHAIRVLRMKTGDELTVIDGSGNKYIGKIAAISGKNCRVEVIDHIVEKPASNLINIAIAPTKNNDRFEWFLEKATELGVSEIFPFTSFHSERKSIKEERLNKVLIAATKQSQRMFLPKLHQLASFNEIIKLQAGEKFIAHCYDGETKPHLFEAATGRKDVLVLIGPEGDFSKDEVDIALQANFKPVSLGQNRLRTETAGIAACHSLLLKREKP